MNENNPETLVEDTFSGKYNEEKFRKFIIELLGGSGKFERLDKTLNSEQIEPKSFRDKITSLKYLGEFKGNDKKTIDILAVALKDFNTLERARTSQRNFIARQLEHSFKNAALVAFYTDDKENPEWRFSLVQMYYTLEKGKVKKEITSAKRSSFLVGAGEEKTHTAKQQLSSLLTLDNVSLQQLEKAFSVEPVTEEFYREYETLYEYLCDHLQNNKKAILHLKDYQGKQIPVGDFAKHLLGQLVFLYFLQKKRLLGAPKNKHFDEGKTDFLHKLYKTNKEKGDKNFYDNILTHILHRALATDRSKKNESDYYPEFGGKIPYLNGGLFEPFRGYDWKQPLNISNEIFEKIFKIFDTYNFTVHEDEPLENEVAIDPEMLGKVFENLIPENERKGSGTFYTPREIVYYMCQESLIDYLYRGFEDTDPRDDSKIYKAIEKFVIESELSDPIKQSVKDIDQALQDVRICDPAIGSGAFPVAMMLEIVRLRMALDKMIEREESLTAYQCKRYCIENCLYGIDNEASAVDIARLRFWLSLIIEEEARKIDEETNSSQDDRIVPLPNLDYKIIQGDALLRKESQNLFSPRLRDVVKLMRQYFSKNDKEEKLKLKKSIEPEIQALLKKGRDMRLYFSEVFDKSARDNRPGFDIIIANPPYIQLQKNGGELAKRYKKYDYKCLTRSGDIYVLFYERVIRDLLRVGGRLAFITSNKWMRANYGKDLRNFFISRTTPVTLVDLGANAFDTATVDTSIIILTKESNFPHKPEDLLYKKLFASIVHEHGKEDLRKYISKNTINMPLPKNDKQWLILSEYEQALLGKIESKCKPLKKWNIEIIFGIKAGCNKAFIIDGKTRDELIAEDPKSEELIKRVLRGRDIKKWQSNWKEIYIILAKYQSHKYLEKDYPAIYHYLLKHREALEKRGQCRYGGKANAGQHHWLELDNNPADTYLNNFQKEKIIYSEIVQSPQFYYDTKKHYSEASTFIMTGKDIKYLIAILNSSISHAIFAKFYAGGGLGNTGIRYKKKFLSELPIPQIPESEQKPLIDLVDKIIAITDSTDIIDDKQQQEIDAIQKQIDELVRRLYELTDAEIEILQKPTQSITT